MPLAGIQDRLRQQPAKQIKLAVFTAELTGNRRSDTFQDWSVTLMSTEMTPDVVQVHTLPDYFLEAISRTGNAADLIWSLICLIRLFLLLQMQIIFWKHMWLTVRWCGMRLICRLIRFICVAKSLSHKVRPIKTACADCIMRKAILSLYKNPVSC